MKLERPVTGVQPVPDVLIHLTPLVPFAIGTAVVGRPDLLLGAVLPLGPLLLGRLLAGQRDAGRRHLVNAIELAFSVGAGLLITYLLILIGLRVTALALLVPLGIFAILLLAANWVFLTAASATRAVRGEINDHPFVFRLRDRVPLPGAPSSV